VPLPHDTEVLAAGEDEDSRRLAAAEARADGPSIITLTSISTSAQAMIMKG
jgi:hypothetical protein